MRTHRFQAYHQPMWVRLTNPKPRSVFWVVSTHVLTTGMMFALLMLVLLALGYGGLERLQPLPPTVNWILLCAFGVVAMGIAVSYSFRCLRERANVQMAQPTACIAPSVATFAGLSIGGYVLVCFAAWQGFTRYGWIELAGLGGFALLTIAIFGLLTKLGFARMPRTAMPGFEVRPLESRPGGY